MKRALHDEEKELLAFVIGICGFSGYLIACAGFNLWILWQAL